MSNTRNFDPNLDLVLERTVALPPSAIWKAWTTPELLKQWFCPAPWKTAECSIDLQPGGLFHTVMEGPEAGQRFDNNGCYLEVVPEERLVWTSAMNAGFRPNVTAPESFSFTAVIEIEPSGSGSVYRVTAIHADEAARQRHAAMGFEQGWSMALDQMVEVMKPVPA